MVKNATAIDKISMIILLLAPILWIYGESEGWNYEVICTLPLSFFFFLYYLFSKGNILGNNDPLPQGLVWYFFYWAFVFIIISVQLPLSMIQSYFAFFLFFSTFKSEYFIRIYKAFALICIVFFFLQEVSYHLTGIRISGAISFLPKSGDITMSEYMSVQAEGLRSCSFFSEPAHFAQFLLPLFAIEIFYDKHKMHIWYAIVIGAALLLLQSGNGILGMAAILFFLLPHYFTKGRKNKWQAFLTATLFISVVVYYYVNSEMGLSLLERQNEISMDYEGGSRSGFLRIWRGFYVFDDYSFFEKIFGCPNDKAQLAHVYSSGMIMNVGAELYFNAFQKILLNTGLVGVGIFVFVCYKIWHNNTICGKAILLTFIVLSFISAIYMTHTMILYLLLADNMKKWKIHQQRC